jgi:hypothetical protein
MPNTTWSKRERQNEVSGRGEHVPSVFYGSIVRVVLIFARQLFVLVKQGAVPMDRVDSEVYDFRRRLTIQAWDEQGRDQHGRKSLRMAENHSGQLRVEVDRAFAEMPEWRQYKEEFRAFAQALVVPSPVAVGNSTSTAEGGPAGSPPAAKPNKTPRRSPDLQTSKKRLALQDALASELATIKMPVQKFCDAEALKREFPDFELWNYINETEIQELADGEKFTPKAFAGNIALRTFGGTSPETLKKDRRKLRKAAQKKTR